MHGRLFSARRSSLEDAIRNFASVVRRAIGAIASVIWMASTPDPAVAHNVDFFDPVATARLRAGEIAREIANSGRDPSVPEPSQTEVFNTGLLLQAGLRALLPVPERQGVALPGDPSPEDPKSLVEAQENYKAVFQSNAEATAAQKGIALAAIKTATRQLSTEGYIALSRTVSEWLKSVVPTENAVRVR